MKPDSSNLDALLEEIRLHRKEWKHEVEQAKVERQRFVEEDDNRRREYIKKEKKSSRWLKLLGAGVVFYFILAIWGNFLPNFFSPSYEDYYADESYLGGSADLSSIQGSYVGEADSELSSVKIEGSKIYYFNNMTESLDVSGSWVSEKEFRGGALWHEDIHDPGDAIYVNLVIKTEGDDIYLGVADMGESVESFTRLTNSTSPSE